MTTEQTQDIPKRGPDDSVEQIVVPCSCPLCVYTIDEEDKPNHPPTVYNRPKRPPAGTLARAIWDARGGPPPEPLQRGFA